MADKLTDKQRLFVKEYLVDLNATQAAIRAGYSEKTARIIAAENLTKPIIQEAIKTALEQREKKIDINSEWVLKRLVELSERCMQGIPVYDREGNETGEWKFEANAANRSLELIGKHLGMFTDKVDTTIRNPEGESFRIDSIPVNERYIGLAQSTANLMGISYDEAAERISKQYNVPIEQLKK